MLKHTFSLMVAAGLALGSAGLQAATSGFPASPNEVPGSPWQHENPRGSRIEANVGATGSVFPSGVNEAGPVEPSAATVGRARFSWGATGPRSPNAQYPHGTPQ